MERFEGTCEFAELFGEFKGLKSKISGGGEDEGTDTGVGEVSVEAVEHGDEEGRSLARAGAGHGNNIGTREDERHGLSLDWSRDTIALALDAAEDSWDQIQRLKPS